MRLEAVRVVVAVLEYEHVPPVRPVFLNPVTAGQEYEVRDTAGREVFLPLV